MGRPKLIKEVDPDLTGHEAVQQSIAQILVERCGIKGCIARLHMEEAAIILKVMKKYDLIKDA